MDFESSKNSNKKRIVFLALTLIMGMGISLAAVYFVYIYNDTRDNEVQTGLVSINYTEGDESVSIKNAVPVIDEIGLESTPYAFTVTNTSVVPINIRFQVLTESNNDIPLGAVRYALYLNDEMIKKDNLGNLEDDNTLYLLENVAAEEVLNAKLFFWVDYYYEEPNKTFSAKLKVTGESFDVIYEETTVSE